MVKLDASSQAALKQASVSPVVLLEDVPYLRQKHVDGCGPTNLAMVLSYQLGFPVSEKELNLFNGEEGGTDPLALLWAFSYWEKSRGIEDIVVHYSATRASLLFQLIPRERRAIGAPAISAPPSGNLISGSFEVNERYLRNVAEAPGMYFRTRLEVRQEIAKVCLELLQSGVSFHSKPESLEHVLGSLNKGLPVMLASGTHWFTIVGYGTRPEEFKPFDMAFIVHDSNFSKYGGGAFQPNTKLVTKLKGQSYSDTFVVAKK